MWVPFAHAALRAGHTRVRVVAPSQSISPSWVIHARQKESQATTLKTGGCSADPAADDCRLCCYGRRLRLGRRDGGVRARFEVAAEANDVIFLVRLC